MVQKEMGFDRWDVFDKGDDFDVNSQINITESHCKRYAKMLEEDPVEDDYKLLMSFLIKKSSNKPLKKRKEKADNEEGTKDFAYGLWLKKSIEHGVAYALEIEGDGLPFLKYEGSVAGLDKECGFSGYKRKLRNGPRKNYGPLNERRITSSEKGAEDSGRRKLKSVSRKNNRSLNESRFPSSEKKDGDSGRGKLRSGLGKNIGPSNESRFILVEEESEDSSRGKLSSGSGKNSRPSDESRFTSSEEDVKDLGRKKLRIGSEKNNEPSDKSMYTSSEEAGDSGRRNLKSGSGKDGRPKGESRFTSSEEDAEDLDWKRIGSKTNNGPSDKSMYTSSEEGEDSGQRKMRSGSGKNSRPSNKSRFTSSEEDVEDLGQRKLRSGLKKNNRLSNESIFTSSEEDAEDLGRRKLGNGSEKNNEPSDKSMYTSSEEAEDSGWRKLRSGSEKNNRPSNKSRFTSSEEDVEDSGRRKLRSGGAKSEKMENGKTSAYVNDEPDYHVFLLNVKCEKDSPVFEDGGERAVIEESNGGKKNHQRDDEWGPFVEILDRDTYYKEVNPGPSVEAVTDGLDNMDKDNINSNFSMQLEFRRQLITVLRKPYDEEEYDKLWEDVKFRKQEKRHLDLRHGRERTCSTDKYGKSYLDHHPDLEKQLSRLDDLENKPKRLNLLRGFFFWLKKASHNGSFHPWKDAECLAINPDSC